MTKILSIALLVVLVAGCNPIRRTRTLQQPVATTALAGVGDVVLKVERYRSLKNAFGKADIFGRKTLEGYTELRFAGVEKTGEVVLYRKDVGIVTNETTMSRTPITTRTGSASTTMHGTTSSSGHVSANARTNFSSTTISPASDYHVVVPEEAMPIRLGPDDTRLPMEGHIVEIIKASPYSLEYRITKQ